MMLGFVSVLFVCFLLLFIYRNVVGPAKEAGVNKSMAVAVVALGSSTCL